MSFWIDPEVPEAACRAALHAGRLVVHSPSTASRALTGSIAQLGEDIFEGSLPDAQHRHEPMAWFVRLQILRQEVLEDTDVRAAVRALLDERGVDMSTTWFDLVRVRAVVSGGHRNPKAAAVYKVHRDTWYANPAAQLNWWLPLHDVTEEEVFAFYPEYFDRPIANDSAAFDYAAWNEEGGWQQPSAAKVYPTVQEPVLGAPVRMALGGASVLRFSGSHLHGMLPHDSGRTRWSCEFRTFHSDDLEAVAERRRVDARAKGTTVGDFLRASDFAPWEDR